MKLQQYVQDALDEEFGVDQITLEYKADQNGYYWWTFVGPLAEAFASPILRDQYPDEPFDHEGVVDYARQQVFQYEVEYERWLETVVEMDAARHGLNEPDAYMEVSEG